MKQSTALELLKQGYSLFLTGQAGAGKTHLLNQYISHLRQHGIPVAITASTGIAATHMDGMTVHSWAGIGIKDSFEKEDYARLKKRTAVIDRLKAVRVLIIDEVSMLHARQLDLIDEVLRFARADDRPFGGVQVIFSGDFFQLPPIGQKGETTKDKFAFMSKAWIALAKDDSEGIPAIKVCYLTEQHRQTDNNTDGLGLNDILNQIRNQAITQQAITTLLATGNNDVLPHRTRLYTHNIDVDSINQTELDKLTTPAHEFTAILTGDPALLETLKKNVRTQETLTLKKGAKVMFIKNNPLEDYHNGTMGEVVDFLVDGDGVIPKVKLNDGRLIIAGYETWSIDDEEGDPLASFSQIPLCLAWAITVHKSQGMTLDAAEIDLSRTFELGQGYVALSRVKSLAGLKLLGLNHKSLLLDDFAQAANRRFLTLSHECELWTLAQDEDDKTARQDAFIQKNAVPALAVKSPTAPKSTAQKPTAGDIASHKKTLPLALAKKSISDIANERALAQSTIIEHLDRLIQERSLTPTDISHLKPNDEIFTKVLSAYTALDEQGEFENGVRLRAIFDELRETVDFATIKICLLFVEGKK